MFGNVGLTALAYSTDQVSDKLCVPETYQSMAPGFNQTNIRQYFMTQIKNTHKPLFFIGGPESYTWSTCDIAPGISLGSHPVVPGPVAGCWPPGVRLPGGDGHANQGSGPKPYKFIRFGDIHGPKPYKFIWFGDIHGPKPYIFSDLVTSMAPWPPNPSKNGGWRSPPPFWMGLEVKRARLDPKYKPFSAPAQALVADGQNPINL